MLQSDLSLSSNPKDGGSAIRAAANDAPPIIASLLPKQIIRGTASLPPQRRLIVNGSNLPVAASQYSVVDSAGQPAPGIRILAASGDATRVTLRLEVLPSTLALEYQLQVKNAAGAISGKALKIVTLDSQRGGFFLAPGVPPTAVPTAYQFVLSYADGIQPNIPPSFVVLNTNDPSKRQISFVISVTKDGVTGPTGVVVDQSQGIISFFVDTPGPWFIQSLYNTAGELLAADVVCYTVFSLPVTIEPGKPCRVEIPYSLATHSVSFQPVDFQGQEIDPVPSDPASRLFFQFYHRQTGSNIGALVPGFGTSLRIAVSNMSSDYSLAAIGAFGQALGSQHLHMYSYSLRRGIGEDVTLGNSVAQLARRQLVAYPGTNDVDSPVFLIPHMGFLVYKDAELTTTPTGDKNPPALGFKAEFLSLATRATAGVPTDIYVRYSADTALDLSESNARMPDSPVFAFMLGTSDRADAFDKILFTSPLFTGDGDQAHSFFSTVRGRFDHLEVPATGQIPLGIRPVFDATFGSRNPQTGNLELKAQHYMATGDNMIPGVGYVTHLAADGSHQGAVRNFLAQAQATLTVKRDDGTMLLSTVLPVASLTPVFASVSNSAPGNYQSVLRHPGTNIGGTLFPVVTKSSFKVGPGIDVGAPALRKLQLLVDGRLSNTVNPASTQNTLQFNVASISGASVQDKLKTVTLALSKVRKDSAGPFQPMSLMMLPNGDWQTTLPIVGKAVRFDLKLVATDRADNRLVARFSLPTDDGQVAGPPPVVDENDN